ncbi:MAG: hypothetical protein KGJ23_13465 [Euryarchaeota archaeon]|nr:hypothetical protein [Euryarchaeota archaeon]MDE2045919.1 hypothetical protein [Thermoplasmata archaeon]
MTDDPSRIPVELDAPWPPRISPYHGEPTDANTATALHILRLLNRAEEEFEEEREQGLEITEIMFECREFWGVREAGSEPELMLRLMLQHKMVSQDDSEHFSWVRQRSVSDLYHITDLGKSYLEAKIIRSGRIS